MQLHQYSASCTNRRSQNTLKTESSTLVTGFHEAALAAFAAKERIEPEKKARLQYTTTSPLMHERLGLKDD